MAYVEPPTFVAETEATAADANILSEDIRYLKGIADGLGTSAVKVNRTSAQSISNDTWTEVSFNNQIFDYGAWWSSGTDITVPAFPAGTTTYLVHVIVLTNFDTNSTGARGIRVLIDGSVVDTATVAAQDGQATTQTFPLMFEVAAADVLTVEVYQNSGGNLNLDGVVCTVVRMFPTA